MSEFEDKLSNIQNIINRLDGELRSIRSQIGFIRSQINRNESIGVKEQPPPKEAVPFEIYLKRQCEED
jgi:hypothetical protein